MMDYLDLALASFFITLAAGIAILITIMAIYYFNYEFENWNLEKRKEEDGREFRQRFEPYINSPKEDEEKENSEIEYFY